VRSAKAFTNARFREICHPWISNLVSNAADIQLRKMMIGGLLQGLLLAE
jgi:hypothetical protein